MTTVRIDRLPTVGRILAVPLASVLLWAATAAAGTPGEPAATADNTAAGAAGGRVEAATEGATEAPEGGLRRDPVESDPRYAEIFRSIDAEVRAELAADPRYRGAGDFERYWAAKKALLKRKHRIDWKSPGELNPNVMFD